MANPKRLGDIRHQSAAASEYVADGNYRAAAELSALVVRNTEEEVASLKQRGADLGVILPWRLEQVRALSVLAVSNLGLGNRMRDGVVEQLMELSEVINSLDLVAIESFGGGYCRHNIFTTDDAQCQVVPCPGDGA